jgi:large subunit ribosomal protein L14
MIQKTTRLSVIDNSGAKTVYCIKNISKPMCNYANLGDLLLVSVKSLRSKRRAFSKVKKGDVCIALILRIRSPYYHFCGDATHYTRNCVVLLSKKNKLIGTRIFGTIPKFFRFTKYLKILSVCSGLSF